MKILIAFLFVFVCSCAVNRQQVQMDVRGRVDPMSIEDRAKFDEDVIACAEFASREMEKIRNDALARTVVGGIIGFGMGALIGSSWGNQTWRKVGTAGAVGGAAGGLASTPSHYDAIIGNCMMNRGYKLLW